MQAIRATLANRVSVMPATSRSFSVTFSELHALDNKLRRELNVLKMMTRDSDFTYEPPEMIYDKTTGDVQIIPKKVKKKGTIIKNSDDLIREKAALYKELGIEGGDLEKHDVAGNLEETAEVLYKTQKIQEEDFDFSPEQFYVSTRDLFRVDVGLMIMRVPIFLHMRDRDIDFMKLRSEVMNEYYCDFKKYVKEYAEVTQLNESVLTENPYASEMNLDNYPTHEWTDPETNETMTYCAASKNFAKVDPMCDDYRSLHYAGEDRTYFLVKNRYTQEWQFPVGKIMFGQTLLRAK